MPQVILRQAEVGQTVSVMIHVSFVPQCEGTLLEPGNILRLLLIPPLMPRNLTDTALDRHNLLSVHELISHCVSDKAKFHGCKLHPHLEVVTATRVLDIKSL